MDKVDGVWCGKEIPLPFFIIGNPRSGTSLLRLMLNSHPEITVPPECGFALWLYDRYSALSEFDDPTYRSFAQDVLACRKFETWGVSESMLVNILRQKMPRSYRQMAACVYSAYAESQDKLSGVIGDKNNYYITQIEKLNTAFELPKIICIVRDGRDVACSYIELAKKSIESIYKPRLSSEISEIAQEWRLNVERAEEVAGSARCFLIRYEDLLVSTESTLSAICEFLGMSYSSSMLDYYLHNDEPAEFLQWKQKTLQPVCADNLYSYRSILGEEEIEVFENIAGDALKRMHYQI